ncbi:hypothetical protein [Roseivirga sp.]|uniref:hypothetical protein n=1 Tax=Roseivirga sp. TaxID=1964215 RepID=UPI003B522F89
MQKLLLTTVISCLFFLNNTSYADKTSVPENSDSRVISIDGNFSDTILPAVNYNDCNCLTPEVDCEKIGDTAEALIIIWTDVDKEKARRIGDIVEEICKILTEK